MRTAVRPAREPARPRARRSRRLMSPVLVVEGGVVKVRLVEHTRVLDGTYMGGSLCKVHRVTLGGEVTDQLVDHTGRIIEGEATAVTEPRVAIASARTKDTIDFGRFREAVTAFLTMVDRAGQEASQAQQEEILRSYQGLLAWQEALAEAVLEADAAMEVATLKVRSAF